MLMVKSVYLRQSHLLVRCLPEIGKRSCFALKGGTAINFFFRPLPRLSVDIDLAFVKDGETGGARTRDHKLKRLVLYRLSYRPTIFGHWRKSAGGSTLLHPPRTSKNPAHPPGTPSVRLACR